MGAIPLFPPFANALNINAINGVINWAGIEMLWMKNHSCPCIGDTGSPNQDCNVCYGRGFYWDPSTGPYIVLLTLISWIGRNVDMGNLADKDYGTVFQGHPILTIPTTANQTLWEQTNTKDIFIHQTAPMRFQATLRVGESETVPAWHILDPATITIAPTGAVVVENPNLGSVGQPVSGVSYTVNGGTVTLLPDADFPAGWPTGTGYVVEYYSPPVFVVEEPYGGLAHVRPFGQGLQYPRRWKISLLDLWLRDHIGLSTNLNLNT